MAQGRAGIGLFFLLGVACLELGAVEDPAAPDDPTQIGATLFVAVGGASPPEVVAFEGFNPLDSLVATEGRRFFRLAYRSELGALGLRAGPVALSTPDDPLARPLPEPDFGYQLVEDGWAADEGLLETLQSVRIPGTDLEGCAQAGGCYLDDEARDTRNCSLDCATQLDFDPIPPTLPTLSGPGCGAPRNLVVEDFEIQPTGGVLQHARCVPSAAVDCSEEAYRTVGGSCAPRLDCGVAPWTTRVGAVDYWVPDRPAGIMNGEIRATLTAAIDDAQDGDVIAFTGEHTLSGRVPGVQLRGLCPDQASLQLIDASTESVLRMDHLRLRPQGDFQGDFLVTDGELSALQAVNGGDWEVARGRVSGGAALAPSALTTRDVELSLGTLAVQGSLQTVDSLLQVDDLVVSGDWQLEGSELVSGRIELEGQWTAQESLVRGPSPGNDFVVGAVAWRDVSLDLEGDGGSLMRVEDGGTMERVAATRTDGAPSVLRIGAEAELVVTDATFRNVELVARGGQLMLMDVATFGAGRMAALRSEGGVITARRLAFVRPDVAFVARSGADLDLRDVVISESGCEPVAIGANVVRSPVDEGLRLARGCVATVFTDQTIPEDDENFVHIERMAVQDGSNVDFLKSQVQVVGEGRFSASDVRLARSPGRGFLFQGGMELELTRILVQDAVPLGACFFPGLRVEAYPPNASVVGQPTVRLTDIRIEDMAVGLTLLEDAGSSTPIDVQFDGLTVLGMGAQQGGVGVVRATVQDKLSGLGVDLAKWLRRGVFVDVASITSGSPNDACD